MKNKIKYLLFLALLLFPIGVLAAGGVSVSPSSLNISPGGTASFKVTASNAAGKVVITSSDTSIVTVNKGTEWVENGTLTVTATGKKTGNAKITIVVDAATFDSEVVKKTYTINVRVKSTNNNLSSLYLSNGKLSPNFSASTTSYTSTITAASTTITAKAVDAKAKVSGTGTKTLKYGKNTFKVIVTSEAGSTKTYTIVINRTDNRNSNNNLKALSTSVGNIAFNKGTTSYNLNIAANVNSIKVNASLEDSKASFVSGYGPRSVNLKYGNNAIQIKVKAENEKVKTYTINVKREDNRSTNNNLSSITLSEGNIAFNKDTLNYNVSVPYEITKVEITATLEDSKAKMTINNPILNVGDNTAKIVVTSESGSVKTYTLNIKRLTEAEKMSDNNKVSTIDIFGHDFELIEDVFEYDINIGSSENNLKFDVLMEDERAYFVIEGNENLKDGSFITLKAISESGLEQEYKFNIKKEHIQSNKSNFGTYIIAYLLCLILGYGMGILTPIIIKKLKSKNIVDLS